MGRFELESSLDPRKVLHPWRAGKICLFPPQPFTFPIFNRSQLLPSRAAHTLLLYLPLSPQPFTFPLFNRSQLLPSRAAHAPLLYLPLSPTAFHLSPFQPFSTAPVPSSTHPAALSASFPHSLSPFPFSTVLNCSRPEQLPLFNRSQLLPSRAAHTLLLYMSQRCDVRTVSLA